MFAFSTDFVLLSACDTEVFHASNTDTIVGNKLYAWRYPFGISLSISLIPISVRKIFSRPC